MLESYKLFKNKRGKFISLELHQGHTRWEMKYINHRGRHKFIRFVKVGDEDALVKSLELKEATMSEQALNALYISSPELEVTEWEWEHTL